MSLPGVQRFWSFYNITRLLMKFLNWKPDSTCALRSLANAQDIPVVVQQGETLA